ncbi:hypothetical protein KKC22_13340 [Myxococcota bacterium]|nr:hypothetical protein [Myxococcota bacterium]
MTAGPIDAFLNHETDTLVVGGVEFFVVQERAMEWAALVRRRILCDPPAGVATVLPETIRGLVPHALSLLPALGLLTHAREGGEDGAPALALIPVEATDPRWEALRSAIDQNIPWRTVAPDTGQGESLDPVEPDTLLAAAVAEADLMRLAILAEQAPVSETAARVAAFHLRELAVPHDLPVLFVCTAAWVRPVVAALSSNESSVPLRRVRREDLRVHLASDQLAQLISAEPMGFIKRYESWRSQSADGMADWRLLGGSGLPPGRWEMTLALLHEARGHYEAEYSTVLPAALIAPLLKYARNLGLTQNRLFPVRYDLVIAARSFYDHNFGWIFFGLLTGAASPPAGADAPRLDLDPGELGISLRTVHFGLKLRQHIPRFLSAYMERPKEPTPGAWKNAFDEASMCSFPPEDILIEGTALQLKDKGRDTLGERQMRSHPFSTTLLDGLDVRETVRHWYEKRLYVREEFSGRNKVGSVVIIFDEDDGPTDAGAHSAAADEAPHVMEHYPYCAHWHGEHTQESDMAFYATDPDEHVVGPGICRCEYGGLLLTSPPGRMWPIWEDPHLRHFRRKSQVLLAAGLQLTREPVVLYISPHPPHPFLKRIALRMGLRVLHMPLGSLSPQRIRRLRTFHILAHHQARSWAHRFIPDP